MQQADSEMCRTLYQRVAKTLGSSGFHFIRTVILPASVPQVISGLRIAWAFSWRALMAGELLGAGGGLGQLVGNRKVAWSNGSSHFGHDHYCSDRNNYG